MESGKTDLRETWLEWPKKVSDVTKPRN